ncbi:MAG: hypothetical protein K1X75_01155 [Leptospirales bacterium]|nr:hypothetical protein [Leptospirales bacterium]
MIFFALYAAAGIYLLLIAAGLLHRSFLLSLDGHRRSSIRLAIAIFGLGVLLTGLYYVWLYRNDQAYRQDLRRYEQHRPPAEIGPLQSQPQSFPADN